MKVQLSRLIVVVMLLVALVFIGIAVFRNQNFTAVVPDVVTSHSPSPTPQIFYDTPINNSVTYEKMSQFSGSVVGKIILDGRASIESGDYTFNNKLSDYTKFSDGEVSYLELPNEPVVINRKEQLVADPIERMNTIRIYATQWNDVPLLRISTSSFDEVIKYERNQLIELGFNANKIKNHDVVAFGQNGIELEVNDEVKYQDYFRLIVPLNGYVYVFYLQVSHDGQAVYPIQSSFEFNH